MSQLQAHVIRSGALVPMITSLVIMIYLLSQGAVMVWKNQAAAFVAIAILTYILMMYLLLRLFRSVAPRTMYEALAFSLVGTVLHGYLVIAQGYRPKTFGGHDGTWIVSQLLMATGIVLLAFVLWRGQIGHKGVALMFYVFGGTWILRAVSFNNIGLYSAFTFVSDFFGSFAFIGLMIVLFLQGISIMSESVERTAGRLSTREV